MSGNLRPAVAIVDVEVSTPAFEHLEASPSRPCFGAAELRLPNFDMVDAAARPHPEPMDFDLDLFDRKRSHRSDRRRHRGDDRGDRRRRAHPHVLAWLVRAGGAVLLGLIVIAVASSLGVWGHVADLYFAATRAVMPASWHDGWTALPGIAHVAIGLGALFVLIGLTSEILD